MSNKELIEKDLEEVALRQRNQMLRNLEHYHWLKENGYILFETITGSQAHGTSTEKSDIDKAFVYILPENDILGTQYIEQLKIHKDFMGYEIRRFLELLMKNNPTILELLNSPEDCVLIKHPAFDLLLEQKDKFITKVCRDSFYGYAKQQIIKAKGLNKKQNWEKNRVTRKNPIDFCYVISGYNSIPLTKWLEDHGMEQKFCGVTAINHCKDLFTLFYDTKAHSCFSESIPEETREEYKTFLKESGKSVGLGYKGVSFEDSNDIRRSNIPLEVRDEYRCYFSYNKDGYNQHCIEYNDYQKWLVDRNENRWVEVQGHGQQIDGKNLMHCMRLINIGKEIAEGKGVQIRRPDAQELLKIRRGEVSLQELIDRADSLLNEMKALYDNSNLPESVSEKFVHELLVQIRKSFYKLNSEIIDFASFIANKESENIFFKKRFGNLSELQSLMRKEMDKEVEEYYSGNVNDFIEDYSSAWLNVIPSDMWPEEKGEAIDTENVRILKSTRDKVTVVAGGDWQEGRQFDIVMWADGAAVINVKPASDSNEEVKYEDFLKQLGYEPTKDND